MRHVHVCTCTATVVHMECLLDSSKKISLPASLRGAPRAMQPRAVFFLLEPTSLWPRNGFRLDDDPAVVASGRDAVREFWLRVGSPVLAPDFVGLARCPYRATIVYFMLRPS